MGPEDSFGDGASASVDCEGAVFGAWTGDGEGAKRGYLLPLLK